MQMLVEEVLLLIQPQSTVMKDTLALVSVAQNIYTWLCYNATAHAVQMS
jgi:hypothetical protein